LEIQTLKMTMSLKLRMIKKAEYLEKEGQKRLESLIRKKEKRKKKKHHADRDGAEGEEGMGSSKRKRSRKEEDAGGDKKRRRSSDSSRRKHSNTMELSGEQHYDQTDNDSRMDSGHVAAPPEEENEFDQAMKRISSSRKKKKDIDTNKLNERHDFLIHNMEEAYEEDKRLNQAQQPAYSKIKLLPEVERELKIKDKENTDSLLGRDILPVLRKWLEPLPDKSLPNVKIREVLLEYLERTQVEREQLKNSGIGKAVMFLWKHPGETPKNKKIAQKIIEEWSRPIFGLSANYSDLRNYSNPISRPIRIDNSRNNETAPAKVNLEAALESKSKSAKVGESNYSLHARIPQRMCFDFVTPPEPKVTKSETENMQQEAKRQAMQFHKLNKHLQQMRKPTQKNIRAIKPSIEGR